MQDKQDVSNRLISAVLGGQLEAVKELISSYGLSYSKAWSQGYVLLRDALEFKHSDVAKLLLTFTSKVNSTNASTNTPLHLAVRNGDIEIVKMILDKRAKIDAQNENGRTPLHKAIENKNTEIIELLLKYKADVNVSDNDGLSPLHAVVKLGDLKIVENLLKNGANVDCACVSTWKKGYTPLHFAVEKGNGKVVTLLLGSGAKVDVKDKHGITPLHIAALKGYTRIAEDLLNHGACINSSTLNDGKTALHFASEKGHEEAVKLFLNRGADINAGTKNNNEETALHFASEKGHAKVVETLLEYGSDINITNNKIIIHTRLYIEINKLKPGYCGGYQYIKTAEALKRHIVKLKTANLYVRDKNLLPFSGLKSKFHFKCIEEITRMKSQKISTTNISFYDVLTKDTMLLARYLRNENIMQVLKSDEYKTTFKIYGSLIRSHFRKGMKKKELLEQGNTIFHFLFKNLPELPYDCIEKIFCYLRDEDLRILFDACKHLSNSNSNTEETRQSLLQGKL